MPDKRYHDLPGPVMAFLSDTAGQRLDAVDVYDLAFLNWAIGQTEPGLVVEIGTASGFSARAMALMLEEIGLEQSHIWTCDMRARCYWDDSLPVGFLLEGLPSERVTQETGVMALDAVDRFDPGSVGLAFVDASHQHPWPLIDTLCLLPLMAADMPVVHHDLQLYADPNNRVGVGPKMLFDQIPPEDRITAAELGEDAGRNNIFALRRDADYRAQGLMLAQAFCLPWSVVHPLDPAFVSRLTAFLRETYPPRVAEMFEIGLTRDLHRRAAKPPTPPAPLWRRVARRVLRRG